MREVPVQNRVPAHEGVLEPVLVSPAIDLGRVNLQGIHVVCQKLLPVQLATVVDEHFSLPGLI